MEHPTARDLLADALRELALIRNNLAARRAEASIREAMDVLVTLRGFISGQRGAWPSKERMAQEMKENL